MILMPHYQDRQGGTGRFSALLNAISEGLPRSLSKRARR
jgi:hypothetical protein